MKKILSIVLALILSLSFVGCKSSKTDNVGVLSDIENLVNMKNVRSIDSKGGFKDLNQDEQIYFNYIFIEALKKIDTKTLSKLIHDPVAMEYLETIKNNPDRKHLWDITIGQYRYLPESRYLVYQNPMHIYSMWMVDAYKNTDPDFSAQAIGRYDFSQVINVYNTYYPKALYTYKQIDFSNLHSLQALFYETLRIIPLDIAANGNLFEYVFFEDELFFSPASTLSDPENFPEWPNFENFELDKMIPVMEESLDFYHEFEDEFNLYFKNPKNKAALQKYLNEKCFIFHNPTELSYFAQISKDSLSLTKAEKTYISDIELYEYGFFKTALSYQYQTRAFINGAISYGVIEPLNNK